MSRTFAKNLRAYRTMAHMTQADLAKAAETTRSAVNNYELAKSEPSFEVLCKFSTVLGVSFDDLINEHEYYQEFIRRVQVTDEEWAVLNAYRAADPVYRVIALDILRAHKKGG